MRDADPVKGWLWLAWLWTMIGLVALAWEERVPSSTWFFIFALVAGLGAVIADTGEPRRGGGT